MTRRDALALPFALGAASAAPGKDRISLAAWSINRSFFQHHRWKNSDLPRICRDLGIPAVEFVNQFFDNPTMRSLQLLNRQGREHGVEFVRIMVDDEGNMAAVDPAERRTSAIAHRKWVDIAHFLGCRDIRCNMRGGPEDWKQDKDLVKRAAESFRNLVDYAKGSGLDIIIENHGRSSSDAEVLAALMKAVNDPRFGTLPDFGNINPGDDPYAVIRKLMPWAKGVSVKAMWNVDGSHPRYDVAKMCQMCLEMGFHGVWGIESSYNRELRDAGSDETWAAEIKGVQMTKAVIEKVVFRT